MKKTFLCAAIFFLAANAIQAQEQETVFSGSRLTGIWGGLSYQASSYSDDDWTYNRGGYLGIEFNKMIFLGWGNYRFKEVAETDAGVGFKMKYGGLVLGIVPGSRKVVHPRFNLLAGQGRVNLEDGASDRVWVMQPSLGVEVNLFKWCRLGLEGGYRFVSNSDFVEVSDKDLSALFGQLDLRFGLTW